MTILEYFDVEHTEHLRAFAYLRETDRWPEGFVPESTEFPMRWFEQLALQMADRWVQHRLSQEG